MQDAVFPGKACVTIVSAWYAHLGDVRMDGQPVVWGDVPSGRDGISVELLSSHDISTVLHRL